MIGILDLGICNLKSIHSAVCSLGYDIKIINQTNFKDIKDMSRMILPGVGSYSNISKNLHNSSDLSEELNKHVISGKYFLGICLGMQFLSTKGYEHGLSKGLNFIPGKVIKIETEKNLKIPHIGWNEIKILEKNKILNEIEENTNFYFVHSFYFVPDEKKTILAETNYGIKIPAIVMKNNIFGFQFHPEKSSKKGLKLLDNYCSM